MNAIVNIRPQPGPQEAFLSTPADIAIYGGAAGGGKTFGLLLEPLRHVLCNRSFAAIFFRRNTTHIRAPGGLWDESIKLYSQIKGKPSENTLEWSWRGGGKIKMAHLEYESTVYSYQGAQIPLICFDELTHFSESQFFYMLSRNRSTCGTRPYIRATCNPDADSWVAKFISWWIDQETGYAIPERSGKVRWVARVNEELVWADTREEMFEKHGVPYLTWDHDDQIRPKSVTFIPAKLTDNQALMRADPDYRANLMAMGRVERERLLNGNWKIRPAAGMYFRRSEVQILEELPADITKWVRRWDLAASEPTQEYPDPDYTAGVKMGLRRDGSYVIAHVVRGQLRSSKVRELVENTAKIDGYKVQVGLAQDPGQAGKEQTESYIKDNLVGFNAKNTGRETGDKIVRANAYSAQWQIGNIYLVRGTWNEDFLDEHENFGSGKGHDDQVDAAAGAFSMLHTSSISTWKKLGAA